MLIAFDRGTCDMLDGNAASRSVVVNGANRGDDDSATTAIEFVADCCCCCLGLSVCIAWRGNGGGGSGRDCCSVIVVLRTVRSVSTGRDSSPVSFVSSIDCCGCGLGPTIGVCTTWLRGGGGGCCWGINDCDRVPTCGSFWTLEDGTAGMVSFTNCWTIGGGTGGHNDAGGRVVVVVVLNGPATRLRVVVSTDFVVGHCGGGGTSSTDT